MIFILTFVGQVFTIKLVYDCSNIQTWIKIKNHIIKISSQSEITFEAAILQNLKFLFY